MAAGDGRDRSGLRPDLRLAGSRSRAWADDRSIELPDLKAVNSANQKMMSANQPRLVGLVGVVPEE